MGSFRTGDFAVRASLTAWHDAAAWWPVYGTMTEEEENE
jgi:hypothetical protein